MGSARRDDSATIPRGTVTFAFTDIEGSTRRWDRDRAAMEGAVRRHDALMRAAIVARDGHVFKTIGDAFCAAFSRPEDAVAAMVDAQRALAREDFAAVDGLRVRAALHTGTADERDRDYFGPAVNTVARLLGIARGGTVLLSGVTADLVRESLPPQVELRDCGEHRLRDLSRPLRVHQLLAVGLVDDPPPLRSLAGPPTNLPRAMTSFVAREDEVAEIAAMLARHRLVTIVGSGGVGKTRTSLRVAEAVTQEWHDGVWLIELAPLASGAYVATSVAQALALTLPSEGDPLDHLARALAAKRALLIFDNCEHLVDATARAILAVLRACPDVKVLASSRQALGIAGEMTFRMPSLAVPRAEDAATLTAAAATTFAALALFVDRARAADHRFVLTDELAPIVADVCRRLDGIALAIELAAARVKHLHPRQIRDRLDERFRILTGGSRDLLPRQQTLRALVDWSYDLLDERERTLFRRLGVFANGFTEAAAVAVCGDDASAAIDVFDTLASLVDKSLVLAETSADVPRFRLLETTRAYAAERALAAGESDALARRHLRHLHERFAALDAQLERTARDTEIADALATDLDDVRGALDRALASDVVAGARLLAAIERVWETVGVAQEGSARLEAFVSALPNGEAALRATLTGTLAALLLAAGQDARALELATRAVADARASDDVGALAHALRALAVITIASADADAGAGERALAEAEAIVGTSARMRRSLLEVRARLGVRTGDLAGAGAVFEGLRREARANGNVRGEHIFTMQLADVEMQRGRTSAATALLHEILPAARDGADRSLLANILSNLAGYLAADGRPTEALARVREAIEVVAAREPDHVFVVMALQSAALAWARCGDLPRAARLAAYVDAALHRLGAARDLVERRNGERLAALARDGLGAAALADCFAAGAALDAREAIALAHAWPSAANTSVLAEIDTVAPL